MRNTLALSLLAVGTLLVTGAVAQHEGHTAPPAADKSAGMPMNGMMGQMMPMMAMHAEVAKLVDQLVTGLAAIESEKDPAALKEKLAEHGKLLKELQTKLQGQSQMMEHMHGMMMGGMMPAGDKKQ
ncbi:MAG: hypothetical protein LAP61_20005 [Acidobacteriia bacterium]|nr:hypothetical protein [Terriglobia bacterium]